MIARQAALSSLALAAGALPRPRRSSDRPRLLALRPDHLGDLLLASAVLAELRRRRPEAEIWALVGPWSAAVLASSPDVDHVLTYPFPWFDRRPLPWPPERYAAAGALATWLRALAFDEAIVLRPDHWWGALALALARMPTRVGYGWPELRPLLTRALPPPGREHAVVSGLRLVGGDAAAADARPGSPATRFAIAPCDRLAAARLLAAAGLADRAPAAEPSGRARAGQPPDRDPIAEPSDRARASQTSEGGLAGRLGYALLHPGASSGVKRWPAERWARVADDLAGRGRAVLLAAGPGEEAELAAIERHARVRHARLPRPPSLGELAALLAGAELALGVDSAPMHLATAVGTPTLRLFGPGDEELFGPWGDPARHRAVRAPGTGPDPSWFGRGGGSHPSLLALDVERVLAELGGAGALTERFERILVVKLGDLGDLILTTPALRALRRAWPAATIDLLAPPAAAPVVAGSDLVDAHLRLPRAALESALRRGPLGLPIAVAFAGALRRRRYDAVVLLQHLTTAAGTARYAALLAASGAPRRFGLDNGRGLFLTDREPDAGFGVRHEAEHWLAVVARLGADPRPRPPELPTGPADHARAGALLDGLPRPIVAVHAGSGAYSTARRWAPDRFVTVASTLAERRGAGLVVVGGEAALNGAIAAATGARDLTDQTSVGELAALLARVDLLICNDGGVMHVGVAANAPIVAIYGLTHPRVWGPWYGDPARQPRAEVVDVPLPCRPCFYRGHKLGWRDGCATRDCLALVSPAMVVAAAERQLDRWRPAIADPA